MSGPSDWLDEVRDDADDLPQPPPRFSSLVDPDTADNEAAEDAALATFLSELDSARLQPRSSSSSSSSSQAPAPAERRGRGRGRGRRFGGGGRGFGDFGGGAPPRTRGRPRGANALRSAPTAAPPLPRPVYEAPDADGIEASSYGGQLVTLVPTKVMVFIDGSWLYYTLFERGRRCPIVQQYGAGWYHSHHVDWNGLPQLISDHVSAELLRMMPNAERAVEVVRVLVYSSFREDQDVGTEREKMFRALQALNFEVHLGTFTGAQEKCVDISLAVDMLHYATIPHALDVAVLVSGDRDFIPALLRTRQKGKRVAVCSMRNSASAEFSDPNAHVKDFEVCWLDDHLDKLIAPIHPSLQGQRPAMVRMLREVVVDAVAEAGGTMTLLQLRAHLAQVALGSSSAQQYISHEFSSLPAFLRRFPADLSLRQAANREALVALVGAPTTTAAPRKRRPPPQQQPPQTQTPQQQVAGTSGEYSAQLEAAELMAGLIPEADEADEGPVEDGDEWWEEAEQAEEVAQGAAPSLDDALMVAEQLLPSRQKGGGKRRSGRGAVSAAQAAQAAADAAKTAEEKAELREKLVELLDTLVEEETPAFEDAAEFEARGADAEEMSERESA